MTLVEDEDDERFDRLEAETRRLNHSIAGLTKALVSTSEMQAKLAGLDERQKTVESVVVPREELDSRVNAVQREQAVYRRTMVRRLTVAGVVIALLVTGLIVGASIAGHAFHQDQLHFQKLQYQQCMSGKQGIRTLRSYVSRQRDAEIHSADPPDLKKLRLSNFDQLLTQYPEPTQDCGLDPFPGKP